MAHWSHRFLLLSSAFVSHLVGWGTSNYAIPPLQTSPAIPSSASFPLNADQGWFVSPSLLVWRPYQDDIDSGFSLTIPSVTPTISKDKTQNVRFKWGTGVRLSLGRYLPKHEQWDVVFASTYFYSDTDQTIHGKGFSAQSLSLTQLKTITEGWNPRLLGTSLKTRLNWKINYFTWDLAAGRLYRLTPKIVVHPYLCLRSMLIYEEYSNRNESVAVSALQSFELRKTTFKTFNNVWGVGPRLGSDFGFYFGRGWSLMGGLSGAITMGRYNIREKINGFILADPNNPSVPAKLKIQDADTNMHANLEGNIGLGWEKWVRGHSVRLAPSFIFEVTQWFLINNWIATNLPTTTPGDPDWGMLSARRMGDLGFLGFTLNLQIDF